MRNKLLFSVLVSLTVILMIGCDALQDKPASNPVKSETLAVLLVDTISVPVDYSGLETLDEMLKNYQQLVAAGMPALNETQEKQMIADFLAPRHKSPSLAAAAGTTVIAYTTYYVWHGSDRDLYLEYKWYAGTRQGYRFETPIWSLYYAIKLCYGGQILNWTWMEGGYQRVTAVVGICVWGPFGSEFTRQYLRVVTS